MTRVLVDAELAKELADGNLTAEQIVIRHALTIMRLRDALECVERATWLEGPPTEKRMLAIRMIADTALKTNHAYPV